MTRTGPQRSTGEGLLSRPFSIIVIVLFAASFAMLRYSQATQLCDLASQSGATAQPEWGHSAPRCPAERSGISPGLAAAAVSVLGGATLLGRLATGWLLDPYFAPRLAVCLLAVAAIGTYLLAVAHSGSISYLGAAFIGFGMGGEADVTPYLLSRYFGLSSSSTLYGFSWTAYALA